MLICRRVRFVSDPMLEGMVPVKLLILARRPVSFASDPMLEGIVPAKLLVSRLMVVIYPPAQVTLLPHAHGSDLISEQSPHFGPFVELYRSCQAPQSTAVRFLLLPIQLPVAAETPW
jgi:hypothetical protein